MRLLLLCSLLLVVVVIIPARLSCLSHPGTLGPRTEGTLPCRTNCHTFCPAPRTSEFDQHPDPPPTTPRPVLTAEYTAEAKLALTKLNLAPRRVSRLSLEDEAFRIKALELSDMPCLECVEASASRWAALLATHLSVPPLQRGISPSLLPPCQQPSLKSAARLHPWWCR